MELDDVQSGITGLSGKSEQVFVRISGGALLFAPLPSSVYIERIESLQNIMLTRATGGQVNPQAYADYRDILVQDEHLYPVLPRFVITCRDLPQFWAYIRSKYETYQERREYIWSAFQPLILDLEKGTIKYVTEEDEKAKPLHQSGIKQEQNTTTTSSISTPPIETSSFQSKSTARTDLRTRMVSHLGLSELKNICFDLELDYESFPHDNKLDFVREIIMFTERRKITDRLVEICKAYNPSAQWD